MKYLIFLIMFLISCVKPLPSIPNDVLAELQSDSTQIFNLSGDIDWRTAKNFEQFTKKLKPGDSVYVYIYSDGGEVDAGENIINKMINFKTICIADKALSAAFEIYQHCTIRVYMDRTLLMTHHHYLQFNQNSIEKVPDLLAISFAAYIQEFSLLSRCAARMGMTYGSLISKIEKNGGEWNIYGSDISKYHAADYHIKEYQLIKNK